MVPPWPCLLVSLLVVVHHDSTNWGARAFSSPPAKTTRIPARVPFPTTTRTAQEQQCIGGLSHSRAWMIPSSSSSSSSSPSHLYPRITTKRNENQSFTTRINNNNNHHGPTTSSTSQHMKTNRGENSTDAGPTNGRRQQPPIQQQPQKQQQGNQQQGNQQQPLQQQPTQQQQSPIQQQPSSPVESVTTTTVTNNNNNNNNNIDINDQYASMADLPEHKSVQQEAGPLWDDTTHSTVPHRGPSRKKVLVLCTGGTLTMSNDPTRGNSLAPVQGALTSYLSTMSELTDDPEMPTLVAHEYAPLIDSSDMGPGDWSILAKDIATNYYHFDGFVVLMGTDTMAFAASALTFMFQNLGKPIVFTGSQIPLREPYNDARKNLIMAVIFASSDTVSEVTIFFHDRLLRGCRATKINTSRLLAFDSPNMLPLADIGINIEENDHLFQPPPRGAFRLRTEMDTRLITLRLVPGFDDSMIIQMIRAARGTHLKGLILQLYGTGNLPSLKDDLITCLKEATDAGVCVVVMTQCQSGSVLLGHYATGQALKKAGAVSAGDMTLEATTTKLAYLLGRNDLTMNEVRDLMTVDLRGELTPTDRMPPPPLASTYQKAIAKKNRSRIF